MNIYSSQIKHAIKIITDYNNQTPLTIFLQDYFKNNKNCGSKDRRVIKELVYQYFRLYPFINIHLTIEDKINIIVSVIKFKQSFNQDYSQSSNFFKSLSTHLHQKNALNVLQETENIFFKKNISTHINYEFLKERFLHTPPIFIRLKKPLTITQQKDWQTIMGVYIYNDYTISLQNHNVLEQLNLQEKDYWIQDFASQQLYDLFEINENTKWWDACAGGGGKSLLLYQKSLQENKKIQLWCSDKRKTSIENLKKRFALYQFNSIITFTKDILKDNLKDIANVDNIIIDAPCSGSGTWNRNPENMIYYKPSLIEEYTHLQKKIVEHLFPKLSVNGKIYYITCSVFAQENEHQITHFLNTYSLKNSYQSYLYTHNSEILFVCVLQKS